MMAKYEAEQKVLIEATDKSEQAFKSAEQDKIDLRTFLETIHQMMQKSVAARAFKHHTKIRHISLEVYRILVI